MTRVEIIKVFLSIICLVAYTVPLILHKGIEPIGEPIFIDVFYAVGTAFGIGSYLIIDSFELRRFHEYYLISAGVFFVGLGFIFIFDAVLDRFFRTYWYVVFNLLITFICCALLFFRGLFTRL